MNRMGFSDGLLLYGILGREQALSNEELVSKVKSALAGGCDIVQLREKNIDSATYYHRALLLREVTREAGKKLFINDRLDIAMAVEADGVHLGQEDLPLSQARKLWPKGLIGITVRDATMARKAELAGADYVGAGPVFAPFSKQLADKPMGYEGLQEIRNHVRIPVFAIGGFDATNIEGLKTTGIQGVATIAALFAQDDPQKNAVELKKLLS
ncbi:thiamine phosphate synthase [Heliorestis acidaminivorans]|nr:thiamine phosphate synthase [Heliorestis acidaminivorans]